ncbi:39S ribosomal protein L23, mitochondrial isoform X2 [Heterocephalus glaber]|uniref:Large ribosomal subunit protein uL23m n=1 Tax=Heterocephalus glaber TaxID=10181 RepID=A0AAX6QZP3_HETGA|nr:39S ribosomal protein L23, mitochondrial isoform X2 [Heterocephalus glaber]
MARNVLVTVGHSGSMRAPWAVTVGLDLWTPQILSFWMLNGGTVPQPQGLMTRYPLYQLGGPQLRVFRTNFFIKLVRPGVAQPEDTVQFRIPMEMTRVDLRNYLERIYNVPVAAVRTRVQHGSNRQRDYRNVRIKKPDYKVAYVQLAHGQTFTFPDLFPETEPSLTDKELQSQSEFLEDVKQRQSSDPRRGGVSDWFGL